MCAEGTCYYGEVSLVALKWLLLPVLLTLLYFMVLLSLVASLHKSYGDLKFCCGIYIVAFYFLKIRILFFIREGVCVSKWSDEPHCPLQQLEFNSSHQPNACEFLLTLGNSYVSHFGRPFRSSLTFKKKKKNRLSWKNSECSSVNLRIHQKKRGFFSCFVSRWNGRTCIA